MYSNYLKKLSQADTKNLITFTFAGLAMVGVVYGLARYSIGFFIPKFIEEFNLSHEQAGWVLSSSYFSSIAAMYPSALLIAKYGPRFSIIGGGILAAFGMSLIAISPNFKLLILGVILAGFSAGFAYPAYSVTINQKISKKSNNVVFGWINSGTGFGIIFAAPIVMSLQFDWRYSWGIFAFAAFCVVAINAVSISNLKTSKDFADLSYKNMIKSLSKISARPLFVSSLAFGLITSSYWAFSVDYLLLKTGDKSNVKLFLILLGGSGALGCFAGNFVNQIGLAKSFRWLILLNALSIVVFPLIDSNLTYLLISGMVFGATFIIGTAVHGMWSLQLYPNDSTLGFATVFFLISLGQGLGAVFGGFIIENFGHAVLFSLFAVFGILLALIPSNWFPHPISD